MPCDRIQTAKVTFGLKTNRNLLVKALEELGRNPALQGDWIQFRNGTYNCATSEFKLTVSAYDNQEEAMNQIKRAYSAQVVVSQAQRFGWTLKKVSRFEYEMVKR
jgi:hypothetical protein